MQAEGIDRDCCVAVGEPVRELRTRYSPKSRVRMAYLNAVPWLDLLLILFFLVLVQSRTIMRPGLAVNLPAYTGGVGVQGGVVAVMTYTGRGRDMVCTVFFADEPFRLNDAGRVAALGEALEETWRDGGVASLTLYADRMVPHEYTMQFMEMAASAGFDQLNLGTKPADLVSP